MQLTPMEPALAGAAGSTPAVTEPLSCRHEVQFYFDDRFLVRSLADYVRNALESGSSAVIVATHSHRENLSRELERLGVDLIKVIEQGRYVSLDAAATLSQFQLNGLPDENLFREVIGGVISVAAAAAHNHRVVIFGEMVMLLWQDGDAASAIRLEQFWNRLSDRHVFHLRCAYPLSSFDQQVHTELFSRICGEHHQVIPAEGYTDLPDENQRLRTVACLQQSEQVLKTQKIEHRIAQEQKRHIQIENQRLSTEIHRRESTEEELRRFTRRLLTARDEEQRRIAAELHENTAQLLAALSLYFGVLHEEKASLNPRLASVVASSRSVSENLLSEIRKLSHLLHPPTLDDVGLSAALQEYAEQVRASNSIKIDLQLADDLGRFDRKLEIAVFRIIEEALVSVRSDSADRSIAVGLERSPNALEIKILINQTTSSEVLSPANSWIMAIHERALAHGGSVQFTSDLTRTLLRLTFPLPGEIPVEA